MNQPLAMDVGLHFPLRACVLRVGPYSFRSFSSDRDELPHTHVVRDVQIAKFWLRPVSEATNHGFRRHELERIARLVVEYEADLIEASYEFFDSENDPKALNVSIRDEKLVVDLVDGRTLLVPLDWYPRLAHATADQQRNWSLVGGGYAIHWPDLDEDIGIKGLLAGKRSGESQNSFERWLSGREPRQ